MASPDIQPLLDELHTVEDNCLYTAQCHFIIASRRGTAVRVVYTSAAVLSALGGLFVTIGGAQYLWAGIVPAVAGVAGAVAASLGADADVYAHRVAANVLTRLRHEARALRESFAHRMSADELAERVMAISTTYNGTIQALPPTDDAAMTKSRKLIQAGVFVPDFREAEKKLTAGDTAKKLPPRGGST